MKFARESWPFVLPFLVAAVAAFAWQRPAWGAGALVTGLLTLLFFRDPARRFTGDDETVLAPAAGLVTRVDVVGSAEQATGGARELGPPVPAGPAGEQAPPELGAGRYHRIVTFLSVFDVHVQKAPVAGEVIASRRAAGRKLAAFRARAGEVNEQHLCVIRRANGDLVGVSQIAGLLARRVVCYLRPGDRVERGQALGLIKFGSRVDLLVPASYRLLVGKGDRLRNGATAVATNLPAPSFPALPAAETASATIGKSG
jgi:phosphatidylserine decarboxylase